jgi:hypothetical protein
VTADDLMRLIGRYTEACDDLGAGLFEQTAADTDAKHGKATFLHGQILTEVHRLHADLAQARQTAEYWKSEHLAGNARIGELHDEADARKCCTCDGAGRGPGRECVVKAGGRLGDLWRCADGLGA